MLDSRLKLCRIILKFIILIMARYSCEVSSPISEDLASIYSKPLLLYICQYLLVHFGRSTLDSIGGRGKAKWGFSNFASSDSMASEI